jgi:hypothetical protein
MVGFFRGDHSPTATIHLQQIYVVFLVGYCRPNPYTTTKRQMVG